VKRIATVLLLVAAAAVFAPHAAARAATCQPALSGLTLSATSVPGGADLTATVMLTCKAPTTVTIDLTGFKGAATPPSVRVAEGKACATAVIRTSVTQAAAHGVIRAVLGQVVREAALTITPTPSTCTTPVLSSLSAPALAYVGQHPRLTVRLSCAAAAPVRVTLASGSTYLPVPPQVTIGHYYQAATISLNPEADEGGQYSATVTASLGSASLTQTITVDPGLASFTIPPCSVPNCVAPDVLFTGVLPAGGATVQLASNNPAITVPSSATFQAGSAGGGFTGLTVNPVTVNTKVTLSATFGGRTLKASTVLVPPWNPSDSLTVSAGQPNPVYGQEYSLNYTAVLSNPAPASGETVTFSSPSPSLELQTITTYIPAGFEDAYVQANTANVTSPVHTTLTATVDGVQASLPVTIEPGLDTITNVPASIVGGQSFTATVNLAGPVDTATTVALQSSWGILTVPGTVTIPAGQSSVSFPVTTVAVTSDSSVYITASLGSSSIYSSSVTLTPPS
jgi:hypothetical protein